MIKVKIPKDNDGRPKQFAFVNYKHEVSVPYGMSLLNGTKLFGRQLKIQFRSGNFFLKLVFVRIVLLQPSFSKQHAGYTSVLICFTIGSSHVNQEGKSPGSTQNPSPLNTPGR